MQNCVKVCLNCTAELDGMLRLGDVDVGFLELCRVRTYTSQNTKLR